MISVRQRDLVATEQPYPLSSASLIVLLAIFSVLLNQPFDSVEDAPSMSLISFFMLELQILLALIISSTTSTVLSLNLSL